jgi:hypothetical protein
MVSQREVGPPVVTSSRYFPVKTCWYYCYALCGRVKPVIRDKTLCYVRLELCVSLTVGLLWCEIPNPNKCRLVESERHVSTWYGIYFFFADFSGIPRDPSKLKSPKVCFFWRLAFGLLYSWSEFCFVFVWDLDRYPARLQGLLEQVLVAGVFNGAVSYIEMV